MPFLKVFIVLSRKHSGAYLLENRDVLKKGSRKSVLLSEKKLDLSPVE